MTTTQFDVFICHASEDKDEVVRPLVATLENKGIRCWYDEKNIAWGQNITKMVNSGLQKSRFVLVILSKVMMGKHWPQQELNSALSDEAGSGNVRVLPLLVGTEDDQKEILSEYPLLRDKLFLKWDGDPDKVATQLFAVLRVDHSANEGSTVSKSIGAIDIPMPRPKAKTTQRDKDIFLSSVFNAIQQYFMIALRELESKGPKYSTDIQMVPPKKFVATIYVDGNLGNRCKIWVGGLGNSDSICYSENNVDPYQDSSINEFLMITEGEDHLRLHATMGSIFGREGETDELDQARAAKYLWMRFIERIS